MYIRVAIFCTSVITENCTLSISGYTRLFYIFLETHKQQVLKRNEAFQSYEVS